jgi:hypothetical protein
MFEMINQGKKSVAINYRNPRGVSLHAPNRYNRCGA